MTEFNLITPLESGGAEVKPIGWSFIRVLTYAVGAGFTIQMVVEESAYGLLAFLPFLFVDALIVMSEKSRALNQLLAFYAAIKEPIFEWQQSPTDGEVFNRAEEHRQLLEDAENALFLPKKIDVVEMYWRDPQFDYCETFEEFTTRREDIRKDYLRNWAKEITKNDDVWRKQFLHNQRIVVKEAQAA